MNTQLLQDIGLTQGETKVYLTLLKLGETTTGPLAKEAEVSASKVYKILDRLINKALVGYTKRGETKYFSALEPGRIRDIMDEKERDLKQKRIEIEQLIPQLESQQSKTNRPKATIYEGFKGITNLFRNILHDLKKGEEYFVIGANYGRDYPGAREFFYNYHRQRFKKGIKVNMLGNPETKGHLEETTYSGANIRFLPPHFISNMQILFYKERAFITVWDRQYPTAILIDSKEAADSFKGYFDTLWKISSK